jgi:molybdopterin synthase catalytic subunit
MNPTQLIETIKQHPDYPKVGMILCHNGVVRATSRDGRQVSGLRITVDQEKLRQVVEANKSRTGIVEILVHINGDMDLKVGEDVMYIVVAGDIRDNVISALQDTLNTIKSTVTQKTQYFV